MVGLKPLILSTTKWSRERRKGLFTGLGYWCGYKIPKWIDVINELQKYVCTNRGYEPGDYSHYATQIENDFVREDLSILLEYGIPVSAIKKIESKLNRKVTEEMLFRILKRPSMLSDPDFLEYEVEKIKSNI